MAKKAGTSLTVIGYARCSTTEQANDGLSIDTQRARIAAWAETNGATLLEVVADEGVSGTKPLGDRAGGKRIAAILEARRTDVDAVIVVRTDRLGRDAAETLTLLKRFRTGRVGLVAVAQHLDLATPHGKAMAAMGAVFGELERDLLAERTSDALAELRRQGRAWNHAPFGWRSEGGHLVTVTDEQRTLARIRALRAEGKGFASVARILNDEGRRTKRGGQWQAMSVRSVERTSASLAS